jgi:hypothetical protein
MQITRTALMTAMTRFAGVGGGVIVGRPGAGKSHALRQLAHELDRSGRRVLPISIDVLGISDLADLREALGIDGDLIKYLREQAPPVECRPAFLLFDAFDAVRSDVGQRQLVNLIRRVTQELAGIWTILVSVRTYDAERSAALLDLFPSGHTEPGFALPGIRCRHFWIPDLNDEERAEAVASITGLPAVYERASPAFRDLLRNPFNLWLMEKILLTQGEHGNLGQITSEVELLELFWKDRVDKGAKADVCQAIARKIARRMVETSSLSAPLGEAYEEQSDHAWRDLYSAEVLVKVGRTKQRVAFGHNMLFDYAVSTLLIDDTPEALAAFLREDSSRPLFLRPSLYYYFSSLWRSDLELFWETYWRIRFDEAVQTRLCATLLPPLIAAHQLLDPAQLDPLLRRRSAERDDTDRALKLLFQAIRFVRSESPRPDTTCDTAWLPVVALLAKDCSDELSYELGSWTDRVLKYAVTPGHEALLRACGAIARDLWRWIWNRRSAPDGTRFDGQASRLMLPLVTRTYGTDRAASRSLLTPVLDLLGTKDFPIDCVYRLCDDLPSIWPHDADFVGETYRRVFGYSEKSEAKTSMGTPVLPMSSTRRQDYQMCYYTLKEHFPEFLKAAPFVASRAALHVIEVYIRKEHIESHTTEGAKEQEPEVFAFLRGQAH